MEQPPAKKSLTLSPGYKLKELTTLLRAAMEESLGEYKITVPQFACLELLGRYSQLSNSELARGAFVSRQAMNKVIKGLEEKELVSRPQQAESGRIRRVQLTPIGAELLAQARERIFSVEKAMVHGLNIEERAQLSELITRCSCNLQKSFNPRPLGESLPSTRRLR